MKIYIHFEIKESAWGGGNQFLKALSRRLNSLGHLADSPSGAQVALFNSHQHITSLVQIKKKFPALRLVHRIDGPISLIRRETQALDRDIYKVSRLLADGVVFQSVWSQLQNIHLGFSPDVPHAVIINAPDSIFFYPRVEPRSPGRIRLVATSWSSNPRKGFDFYSWLDSRLDWSRFEMRFIGNSPIAFRNIQTLKPLDSLELGTQLRGADIFVTASQVDPCSNSLLEGLACGLPAVALRDGGHPELVGKGGLLFADFEEGLRCIENVASNLDSFRKNISVPTLETCTENYLSLFEQVAAQNMSPKSPSTIELARCVLASRESKATRFKGLVQTLF